MKYLISLLLGILTGAALFAAGLAYNPFIGKRALSPLAVTDSQTVSLGYSAVASEGIMFTNDGESRIKPYPEKVQQLWEAPIRQTTAMATVMRDGRNQAAGLGLKIVSTSEDTSLLNGKALVESIWYVYLPGRGSLFIEQSENYWDYLRDIVIPAYRSSANTWKGIWTGNMTAGPGALGTARVVGGSGEFANKEMLAVESLSVRVWRVDEGPIAADGRLTIELPVEFVEEELLTDDVSIEEE
jgi:hypothetical protein